MADLTRAELIERLQALGGPSYEMDRIVTEVTGYPNIYRRADGSIPQNATFPVFTASLDAATALVEKVLPGWSWRVATCCVSDDAWVQPDFNCPVHGERLKRELDEATDWVELTDVDLRPSGRPAIALCLALLRALDAKEGRQG